MSSKDIDWILVETVDIATIERGGMYDILHELGI